MLQISPAVGRLLYTVEEVAEILGKSPRTVWRLISEGKLIVHRDHGTRVTAASVVAYLEKYGG